MYVCIYIYLFFRDTYRGSAAFSEPETKAVRDFIMNQKQNQTFLVSFLYQFGLYAYADVLSRVIDSNPAPKCYLRCI